LIYILIDQRIILEFSIGGVIFKVRRKKSWRGRKKTPSVALPTQQYHMLSQKKENYMTLKQLNLIFSY
jgi:hypothetical protein